MDWIVVRGARQHNLKNLSLQIPRDRLVVITGVSGSGKSSLAFDTLFAEGPAPLRRVALGLRPPVPEPGREARRRLDRGAVAGDLDRAEVGVAQPALDGGHGHRDPRLPAAALRLDRPPALSRVRQADPAADGAADGRPHPGAARGHPAHALRAATCAARRASTAASSRSWRRRASCARASTARRSSSPATCRGSTSRRSTRSRSWSIALVVKDGLRQRLADSLETALAVGSGLVIVAAAGHAGGDPVAELLLRRLRRQPDRGDAATVLVQQPLRRLLRVHRPRHAAPHRRGEADRRPGGARSTVARSRRGATAPARRGGCR